jgi:hypothetical protein
VSASINGILERLAETPGINRKQLAEKIAPTGGEAADAERAKMTLASDLRWLIHEGYVIEFNDGTLDVPRAKPTPAAPPQAKDPASPAVDPAVVASNGVPSGIADAPAEDEGGISIEQSVEPMPSLIGEPAAGDEPKPLSEDDVPSPS